MRRTFDKIFMGDFETTVYEGQTHTEVWAGGLLELKKLSEPIIFNSIETWWNYLRCVNGNLKIYFHNLKFDGEFVLWYLMSKGYNPALTSDENGAQEWVDEYRMKNRTFKCIISDLGQWYLILIKDKNRYIDIRDSLKLLPFSVKKIGEDFETAHKKLDIEYKGFRKAGGIISREEKEYLGNDLFVPAEALNILFDEGHDKLTIGSCAFNEFKKTFVLDEYDLLCPDIYNIIIPEKIYGSKTAGEYVRRSYRGGWCYVASEKKCKLIKNGITLDVNSLYPSVMHSKSGNKYPVGKPTFWKGEIPSICYNDDIYYFVRIKTKFYLRSGYLPFLSIKGNLLYNPHECLRTSDIYDPKTGKYSSKYIDIDGKEKESYVTLTLTKTDWELINEHYILKDCTILDGCYFRSETGIFDEYIDHYRTIKETTQGAKRQLAKLFLNSLYGKMAMSTNSSFKVPYIKDDGSLGFYIVSEHNRVPGYIPIGSAITSYARNFTIRAAQLNYYGDKPGFCYSDTDSLHINLPIDKVRGIELDKTEFGKWDLEGQWSFGWFVRAKTYIEESWNNKKEKMELNIRCAGMPEKCKEIFKYCCGYSNNLDFDKLTDEELDYLDTHNYDITDFNVGISIPGKLRPKHIRGGVILVDTPYKMK